MRKRPYGLAPVLAIVAALAWSTTGALADNPHGTPPGQAKQDQASQTAPGNSANAPGQQATPSAAPTTSSTSSDNSKTNQGGGKYDNSTTPPNTTSNPGVKPSNTTSKWTKATAGSNQTKQYGNGKTAGQIAQSNGASKDTMIYGPGNSQPHKVMDCKHKHLVDVHAAKNYPVNGSCDSSTQQPTTCPSRQNTDSSSHCVADNTTTPCPSGQHMDSSSHCVADNTTTTCPS